MALRSDHQGIVHTSWGTCNEWYGRAAVNYTMADYNVTVTCGSCIAGRIDLSRMMKHLMLESSHFHDPTGMLQHCLEHKGHGYILTVLFAESASRVLLRGLRGNTFQD